MANRMGAVKDMPSVIHKGNVIRINGSLPKVGQQAPEFSLVGSDLSDYTLASFAGQRKVLNIFPSIDTPTCAASVRRFNCEASKMENTVVLCISADLPFAQKRFCASEGLDHVVNLSILRDRGFLENYGVAIAEGARVGLATRAVVVLDEQNKVLHSELVAEVGNEPNYSMVIDALTRDGLK